MAKRDGQMIGRRGFIGLLAGSAAIASVSETAEAAESAPAAQATRAEKSKALYRVTADVEAFYRVNRYPARKE